ncbi:MAG: asparagine synthase-related protein, partial [Candidatus Roizmanbacteria bacterium]|nr:asparagine synthase-related protein [Candidatus Roizmanbacteria bacterium]
IPGTIGTKVHELLFESLLNQEEQYPKLFGCFGEYEKNKFYTKEFKRITSNHNSYTHLEKYISGKSKSIDMLLNMDMLTCLPDDLLVKVDMAGMAHSLEIRSPLLDHKFIEKVARIPESLKVNGFNSKYLLKKIASQYLPKECIERKKQGFGVPLEYWLNSARIKKQLNMLLEENSLLMSYINREEIIYLLDKISGDGSRLEKQDVSNIWLLLCLKTWLDVWFS